MVAAVVMRTILRILTGKKRPQMKLQGFRKA